MMTGLELITGWYLGFCGGFSGVDEMIRERENEEEKK